MMRPLIAAPIALAVFALALGNPPPAPKKGYAAVDEIFKAKCLACHQGPKAAAKFDVSEYAKVMKGSEHGKMVIAGKPAKSPLMDYLKGKKKPQMPMGGKPLKAEELKTISDWITKGAKKA